MPERKRFFSVDVFPKSCSQLICCQPYLSAATDTLLWRVGTSCHRLRRLVIDGSEVRWGVSENGSKFPQVTNKGLFWLCGQPCPELRLRGPTRYVGGFFKGSALYIVLQGSQRRSSVVMKAELVPSVRASHTWACCGALESSWLAFKWFASPWEAFKLFKHKKPWWGEVGYVET